MSSAGSAFSLVSLSQTCCFYRRGTCATSAVCASEAVHRNLCWLIQVSNCRSNIELRFALSVMFAGTNRSETSVEALVEASCFHGQGPTYARQRCCQWTEQA